MYLSVEKDLRKAQSHMKAGELAEAEELYKQVLTKFPKNKKAIQGYQKLKAGITSNKPVKSEPPQEQIDELIELYNQSDFESVLSKVMPMIGLYPKAIVLFDIQGASNAALQRHDEVIDSYKKAIKIKPDFAEAYSNMGNALKAKGDLVEAIDNYKQAIKIKPDFAEAYYNMGIALNDKGELGAAIDSYKQALKIKPDYAEVYYNMGNSLKDKEELDAAIDSYKEAIKINSDYAAAYYNMGIVLMDKGDLDAAIDRYKQALKIKPNFAEVYYNMGIALNNKGALDATVDSYSKAIKIKPDHAEAYNNMGNALKDKGDLNEAIESYQQAINIKPDYVECFINHESLQLQMPEANYIHKELKYLTNKSLKNLLFKNPKHQINQSINSFLQGNCEKSTKYLQRYFSLFERGMTNNLVEKDQVFCVAYAKFIKHLNNKFPTSKSLNTSKIYHVGESHCLSYAHRNLTIQNQTLCVAPLITIGAKAYHFSQPKENAYKAITRGNLEAIPNGSLVLVSIGEIDCRANEGLIQASQKTRVPIEELVQTTLNGYLAWFLEANLSNKHVYKFFNVPAPVYKKEMTLNINQKVADVVCIFNETLRKNIADYSLDLIDVYEPSKDENGFSNNLYHCDDTHLDDRILRIIENQFNE